MNITLNRRQAILLMEAICMFSEATTDALEDHKDQDGKEVEKRVNQFLEDITELEKIATQIKIENGGKSNDSIN